MKLRTKQELRADYKHNRRQVNTSIETEKGTVEITAKKEHKVRGKD